MNVTTRFLHFRGFCHKMYTGKNQIQKERLQKMKKRKTFLTAIFLLTAFVLWTALVALIDVQAIGPMGAQVGFATLNQWFHALTGTRMVLYTITDWLSVIPIGIAAGFAVLGLCQWIKRRKLTAVDPDILLLGVFYITVVAVYVFFELFVINVRPIRIDGNLEASYPSSTTVLVLCVMSTAIMQLKTRLKSKRILSIALTAIVIFTAFMLVGRLLSGVHWLTDIIGGVLISAGLITLYLAFTRSE